MPDKNVAAGNPGLEMALQAQSLALRQLSQEIRDTWRAMRSARGQAQAFAICERMVDRLGYGRLDCDPEREPLGGEVRKCRT